MIIIISRFIFLCPMTWQWDFNVCLNAHSVIMLYYLWTQYKWLLRVCFQVLICAEDEWHRRQLIGATVLRPQTQTVHMWYTRLRVSAALPVECSNICPLSTVRKRIKSPVKYLMHVWCTACVCTGHQDLRLSWQHVLTPLAPRQVWQTSEGTGEQVHWGVGWANLR